jgi:serine/threonine-protein kinase HipA
MNGVRVGDWRLTVRSGHEFVYADTWLSSSVARPLSLSLPLRPSREPYRKGVEEFFENLLPDNRQIRERIQKRFSTRSTRAFDLLREIGRDCVGALQLVPDGDDPPNVHQITGSPLTRENIANLLAGTLGSPFGSDLADGGGFRISIAGAQEKTALLWHQGRWLLPTGATPTTKILKLPIGVGPQGIELSTSVENEWLCAQIVAEYGIDVAKCRLETFGEYKTLVVDRFDRRLAEDKRWYLRLPQEDFCQACGKSPASKYETDGGPGIGKIMDILQNSDQGDRDRRAFMKTQFVYWMLAAIDGHAKNFSIFILPQGAYRLTPRYDILSAYPMLGKGRGKIAREKLAMAMAVRGKNRHYRWAEINSRHYLETARRNGISDMKAIIEEIIAMTPSVIARVKAMLPKGFPDQIAETTFAGIQSCADQVRAELSQ